MRRSSDDAIFEQVAGLQAEDADGFYADVLIGGRIDYGGIGIVGDGAGKNVCAAAARVSDVHQRNFYRLEATVEIEIQAGELPDTKFVVNSDARVDFFARVAIGFEAIFCFEQFDLCGIFFCFGGLGVCGRR